MRNYRFTRWLPYAPEHLFAVVSDVHEYGNFVPLCVGAQVWDVRAEGAVKHFRARLEIAYPKLGLREYFTSDVQADASRLLVVARSSEGAVRDLENRWLFRPRQGGADVLFSLRFRMASRVLQLAMDAAFDYAAGRIFDAFDRRAAELAQQRGMNAQPRN